MTHRDIASKGLSVPVPVYQIESGRRGVTPIGQGFPQPQPVQNRPMRVTSAPPTNLQPRIGLIEGKEPPDSIEYARPIPISGLGSVDNPELDPEFAIGNLGIDLQATEPLLPYVYNVASDSPMIFGGQFPAPASYMSAGDHTSPEQRFQMFSDEALLFVFYIHARDTLQLAAATELRRRHFVYNKETKRWLKADCLFDVDNWCFLKPEEIGRNPVRQ